jgi:ribonuclease VapC
MVIDTSALLAILWNEPERPTFLELIYSDPALAISTITHCEAAIVAKARTQDTAIVTVLDELIQELKLEIVPVDLDMALAARSAYFRFGRGFHRARLNFADCFSYGLAKQRKQPLLFKGNDFALTDIVPACSRETPQ